jgi:hypothetical protein
MRGLKQGKSFCGEGFCAACSTCFEDGPAIKQTIGREPCKGREDGCKPGAGGTDLTHDHLSVVMIDDEDSSLQGLCH